MLKSERKVKKKNVSSGKHLEDASFAASKYPERLEPIRGCYLITTLLSEVWFLQCLRFSSSHS